MNNTEIRSRQSAELVARPDNLRILMTEKSHQKKYKEIKEGIAEFMKDKGFNVCLRDDDLCIVSRVKNTPNVGDEEDKFPDVEGSYSGRIFQRGLAKLEDDIDSKHSITQYKLFAGKGDLVIGIPKGCREKLEKVLDENLNQDERKAIKEILEF